MSKKIAKTVCSVKVYSNFLKEFEEISSQAAGNKGEQVSAGIMAWMAIYQTDKGLASALTNPDLTSETAAKLILTTFQEVIYQRALAALTPQQKAQLLEDAKQSARKAARKKHP
jgi:F0F1-type ATP synthase delta subunit